MKDAQFRYRVLPMLRYAIAVSAFVRAPGIHNMGVNGATYILKLGKYLASSSDCTVPPPPRRANLVK